MIKKIFCVTLGCVGLGLGAVGAVVPMLPSFPFLMLAAVCFAKSSKRLERRFKSTRLYKDNLEDYAAGRGMSRRAKARFMITVTLLMGAGLIVMGLKGILVGCIALGFIWLFHILYFCFGVKTIPIAAKQNDQAS